MSDGLDERARPGTPGEGAAARAAVDRLMASLRPPPKTIIGLRLRLDRTCDRKRGCCDQIGIVRPGRGPHKFSLRCTCGKHRGWIKAAVGDLLAAMLRDGRLTAAPIPRDAGIEP
jgi:hypothetical protein